MSDELRFWSSPNFSRPPRRSRPGPMTRLERIAAKHGIDDEDFRELLRAEIERRRVTLAAQTPRKRLTQPCGLPEEGKGSDPHGY